MRSFLVLFLVSWIVGIIAGLIDQPIFVFVFTLLLFRLNTTFPRPYVVVSIVLFGFGWVYGGVSVVQSGPICRFEKEFVGEVVRVHRIEAGQGQYVVRTGDCDVLLTLARFPEYRVGDELQLKGDVQAVEEISHEYAGYADYLEREGVAGTLRFSEVTILTPGVRMGVDGVRFAVRRQIERVFSEPESAVVKAMLLGQRGTIPDEITEQFRRTGVSHILAISGMHVSVIAGIIILSTIFLPVPSFLRVGVTVGLLWLFVWLIGFPVSATRATIFWTVLLLALELRWLISLPTVVLFAMTVMVTTSPAIIFDVGFQLSVLAVVGIGMTLFIWRQEGLLSGVRRHPLGSVALVSLGAMLTTWPITAYHFGGVAMYGVLANMLVVPVVSVFIPLTLFTVLISFVAPPIAFFGAGLVRLMWWWIEMVTYLGAKSPGAYIEVEVISLWVIGGYYVLFVVVAHKLLKKNGRNWREVWQ